MAELKAIRQAIVDLPRTDDGSAAIVAELQAIKQASNRTANQVAEMGSIAYFVGLFVSLGMNFALGSGLWALLLCLLSWLNVGYIVVGLATGAYAPKP